MAFSPFPFLYVILPQLCLLADIVHGQAATLVYNCAKLPSICRNVNSVNPLLPVVGNAAAGNLGLLDPGQTPGGNNFLTLTLVSWQLDYHKWIVVLFTHKYLIVSVKA
jgi:hypothetical protein